MKTNREEILARYNERPTTLEMVISQLYGNGGSKDVRSVERSAEKTSTTIVTNKQT